MNKNGHKQIEDQAAEWALKLEDGLSSAQEKELESWLETQPDAETQLARFRKSWKRFEMLNPKHFPSQEVDTGKIRSEKGLRRSTMRWIISLGAAAAIALFGISLSLTENKEQDAPHSSQTFEYAEGDFYELEDGSTIDLNEGANVICKYSKERREFWIKSGEAYFTVAKDPNRPFDVHAGETKLRAIGTEFNVKYNKSAIEVLVTEGVVSLSVSSSEPNTSNLDTHQSLKKLVRNQKAVVHQNSELQSAFVIEEIEEAKVSEILLWKPVTLKFDSTPLSEVVEAFNRHNDKKLVIADSRIEALQIVATFRSNKLEGFINLLQATSNVVAEHKGDQVLLSSKN